ncbi:dihydroneopterin aldolase [Sulfurovum sp. XGS-02]|uniref:dihydroneopterin aldolase n=1 Tax=Sulfurovum sp. XGS-02 TaxID=2925411 RepID=UPI00205C373F|nr:dihydroneopterin aldolase [Sulfurovum sp. XGS-02]UPT77224.1 dihydroneopterin aldolase [Sulfurovum sp. XGS-02]
MTIHIEDLTFDVIIGLLDFERDRPQRVIINLQASYDYSDDQFIDYADMVLLIQNELKEKRYELLENALLGLKELLYTTYPQLQTLSLKISKPDILPQCTVSLSKTWNF